VKTEFSSVTNSPICVTYLQGII